MAKRESPNRVAEVRKARGLTQRGLAIDAGLSVATIGGVEKYGSPCREETQEALAAALGVSVLDLFPAKPKGRSAR